MRKKTNHLSEKEIERLDRASDLFVEIGQDVGILSSINWPATVAEDFFANDAKELPKPLYEPMETSALREKIEAAKSLVDGNSPVHHWLQRGAESFSEALSLIETRGTKEFTTHSQNIYGLPNSIFRDGHSSALDIAKEMDGKFDKFCVKTLAGANYDRLYTAQDIRSYMQPHIDHMFGDEAPRIEITDEISAKAVASTSRIRLRANAPFSDLDGPQLLLHEAYIHVATSLNGKAHSRFKFLGTSHAFTAKTQEGLAVFSEMIGGAIDPFRMKRLVNRVLAVQMALDGADFLEVYHNFYLERSKSPREAFENTRRIFRGGVLTGGAPFTKDAIYLEGLVRVHNYLRVAIPTGDSHYPNYLFYGKIDLDDIDAVKMLDEQGLLSFPKYRPPWAEDMRFLATVISYLGFMEKMDLRAIRESFKDVIT